ncbi:hypothetical protein LSS_05071 [Leptospira santarosai serovar Shermani str. LT 821]|uniref:Uncharacterized protein n=1 Tax=Leptospira santarosai serovar Shermani str. LT 821 TaxID=758847 RepID=K8Y3I7_9LEPT|nr:hypothetical protein LSS_05071 [Leptospira santarosai serovar Shermani str. LT 821]
MEYELEVREKVSLFSNKTPCKNSNMFPIRNPTVFRVVGKKKIGFDIKAFSF